MNQEADREARSFGQSVDGVGIPSFLINVKGKNVYGQTRDLTAGGSGTGAEYIETLEKMHQYGLEIAPKAFDLGVTVWTGLTSNVYVTETGEASAVWETEVASADETTPATSKPVNLSPKRLSAFTDISKQLLLQRNIAEQIVKTQLQKANNRKLDHTIFQGTGVSPIPTGITATSGINSFVSGGVPSRQTFLDMWAMLAADNSADLGEISIGTTAAIYAFLEGAYVDAGSGRFVLENGKVNGRNAIWSNNVAADTIIMGDFSQFVVGQWGGYDLLVNPYTKGKEAIIEVIINSFFDMGCLRPTAFVVADDVTLV
jgi:HK97 family phage major capsid protein